MTAEAVKLVDLAETHSIISLPSLALSRISTSDLIGESVGVMSSSPDLLDHERRESSSSSTFSSQTTATTIEDSTPDDLCDPTTVDINRSRGVVGALRGGSRHPPPPSPTHSTRMTPSGAASLDSTTPTSTTATTTTHVSSISIPSASSSAPSMPITIASGNIPVSSVRLSTTPLFPSPLAQTSGPHEESDLWKSSDGEGETEGSGESEIEGEGRRKKRKGGGWEGSPLRREVPELFGDPEMSPSPTSMDLPDSVLTEASIVPITPRASAHRRSASGREPTPETEGGRTERTIRVRSVGRTSGASVTSEDSSVGRRKSRTNDLATDGARIGQSLPWSHTNFTPRPLPSLASSSTSSSSPPSAASSPPTSPISRRASMNAASSPPRTFAPLSPVATRPTRSSLSAALAIPMPSPFPAAPPPIESIKRQRVPESVRSATDFRQPTGLSYLGEPASSVTGSPNLSGSATFGGMALGGRGLGEGSQFLPKTPSATRAPSPVSNSGESMNSDTVRSRVVSTSSSRSSSKGRYGDLSGSTPIASPMFIPGHTSAISSNGSSSAFSPLFPFPSSPSLATHSRTTRDRSRSVYLPGSASSHVLTTTFSSSPTNKSIKQHDLGVSPLSTGVAPLFPPVAATVTSGRNSFGGTSPGSAQRQARGLLATNHHRSSVVESNVGAEAPSESTDEYAQIILASRTAKMKKWKASGTPTSSTTFDTSASWDVEGGRAGSSMRRKPIPAFEEDTSRESGQLQAEDASFEASLGGSKEIEWVDWLDEYRRMKEAKVRAEQEIDAVVSPKTGQSKSLPNDTKGKGKEIVDTNTVTDVTKRRTTGFWPLDVTVSGLSASRPSETLPTPSTAGLTPSPVSPYDLSRSKLISSSTDSSSNLVPSSPGLKRRRNFKLGSKIDAWWSAVRTSFSVTPGDEHHRARRNSSSLGSLVNVASRTSSQYNRPDPSSSKPPLRATASAANLSPVRPPLVTTKSPPIDSPSHLSISSSSRPTTEKLEGRWRNPNLTLSLRQSFDSTSQQPGAELGRTHSDETTRSHPDTASSFNGFAATPVRPILPSSTSAVAPSFAASHASGATPSASGFTPPPGSPLWDQTPSLIPTSRVFPVIDRIKKGGSAGATNWSPSFSMNTVRKHIKLRLSTAKENCDKELVKIILGITAHVEAALSVDSPMIAPVPTFYDGQFGDLVGDDESHYTTFDMDSESEAAVEVDGAESEGGRRTSRPPSRSQSLSAPPTETGVSLGRRGSTSTRVRSHSGRRLSLAPRRSGNSSRQGDLLARRVSNPGTGTVSATSSRSTSRSRSPLPPPQLSNVSRCSRSPARSSTSHIPLAVDLAQSAFIVLLQDIITVATEILDTSISSLTSRPGYCAEYIQRVQTIGKAWDDNSELECRGWYVQLLLAVAGLSRVVEWWEAEKGFWMFEDVDDDADAEPIVFVAKPAEEEATGDGHVPMYSSDSPLLDSDSKVSPLDIALGIQYDEPEGGLSLPPPISVGEMTKRDADDLRLAVEQVRSQTLLMELSLDGQLFQHLSSAWEDLVGFESNDCLDAPIADFLYSEDAAVFAEATRQLEADDSHTVEVRFRLRVASSSTASNDEESGEDLYEIMEGKGMLMLDGLGGGPSHTMWVVRPAPLSEILEGESEYGRETSYRRSLSEPATPFIPVNRTTVKPILCRICDRPTPAWFFEKHNETCNETHRLEHDIAECNDRLKELGRTIDRIVESIDQKDATSPAEYRGIALTTPTPTPTPPTALEGLKFPFLAIKPQSFAVRKAQNRVLDQVSDIVHIALDISTPTVLDEPDSLPIENQRLLSPNSENKLALVMRWQRPVAEEPALIQLIADAEEQTRFKLNSVNRLRNTILYAEKVRQEWEAKAGTILPPVLEDPSPFASPLLQPLPPTTTSTPIIEPLDLHFSGPQTLRSRSSHLFDYFTPPLSPLLGDPMPRSGSTASLALSPRLPSGVPSSRTKTSSIKDFKMLKPISKGAFGSVYLAKKITTGDYYAIKVLKKSDMIAKNQVTNVKAERMILMTQTESDFVVKLYYTFQDKEYLYLVMEYLNGGDCAALVKNMGELPEDWARRYIAEVIVGLEYLHASGIIHRDLKPDNLLIDAKGHLKLTDFGLSRIGLLGRQTRLPRDADHRRPSDSSVRSPSVDAGVSNPSSPSATAMNDMRPSQSSYFGSLLPTDSFSLDTPNSESSGSDARNRTRTQSVAATVDSASIDSPNVASGLLPPPQSSGQRKFVGTPDYLAPESILGIGMDAGVDWWALGVICYEFLYGFPPFHDSTPEKVFENILSRRIEWHDDDVDVSPDARDFMERLMCPDLARRLGVNGAGEVKSHPFLAEIDWQNLLNGEVDFVPKVSDPESTDYFDPRGAVAQVFDQAVGADEGHAVASNSPDPSLVNVATDRLARERSRSQDSPHEEFGTFNFRNLPVLKQANDDVIKKMRDEEESQQSSVDLSTSTTVGSPKRSKSLSGALDFKIFASSSPSDSHSSSISTSARLSHQPASIHSRQSSDSSNPSRNRPRRASINLTHLEPHNRRNSMPTRWRTTSFSELEEQPSVSDSSTRERRKTSGVGLLARSSLSPIEVGAPSLSIITGLPYVPAVSPAVTLSSVDRVRTIDCLVAGKNPISNKVLETVLVRLGCRCVVVPDGGEAILVANSVRFDVIWMDLQMPVVGGEKAARMIKSTRNPSSNAAIIAVCSYGTGIDDEVGTLFAAILSKPVMREQVLLILRRLGFQQKSKSDALARRGSGGDLETGKQDSNESRRGSIPITSSALAN